MATQCLPRYAGGMRRPIVLAAALVVAGCSAASVLPAPRVDGLCAAGEYDPPIASLDGRVPVFRAEDAGSVWLCFDLPDGGFAGGEFTVESPALRAPLILHVSAQLGEWYADEADRKPQAPNSADWWNNEGWTAVPAAFNGMTVHDGAPAPNFRPGRDQEFQFAKDRFGAGPWTMSGRFFTVAGPDGTPGALEVADDAGRPLGVGRTR